MIHQHTALFAGGVPGVARCSCCSAPHIPPPGPRKLPPRHSSQLAGRRGEGAGIEANVLQRPVPARRVLIGQRGQDAFQCVVQGARLLVRIALRDDHFRARCPGQRGRFIGAVVRDDDNAVRLVGLGIQRGDGGARWIFLVVRRLSGATICPSQCFPVVVLHCSTPRVLLLLLLQTRPGGRNGCRAFGVTEPSVVLNSPAARGRGHAFRGRSRAHHWAEFGTAAGGDVCSRWAGAGLREAVNPSSRAGHAGLAMPGWPCRAGHAGLAMPGWPCRAGHAWRCGPVPQLRGGWPGRWSAGGRRPAAGGLSARARGSVPGPRAGPDGTDRAEGQGQRSQRERGRGRATGMTARAMTNGTSRHADVHRGCAGRRAAPRACVCPTSVSEPMSRRLLIISSAQDSRPGGTRPARASVSGPSARRRSGHRGQPEEREYRDLAQPAVPVRMVAARVEPGRARPRRADEDEPPRREDREHQAGDARAGKQANAAASTCRAGAQPRGDQPGRPDAPLVRAADAVAVVVGVVDADLQGERHDQGEHCAPGRRTGRSR